MRRFKDSPALRLLTSSLLKQLAHVFLASGSKATGHFVTESSQPGAGTTLIRGRIRYESNSTVSDEHVRLSLQSTSIPKGTHS